MTVPTLLVGPRGHGVARHARLVAAAIGSPVLAPGVPLVRADLPLVHVPFADGLFGATTEDAAAAFRRLLPSSGPAVVASLHDLPELDPSPRSARRRATYRAVVERSAAVIVSSEHERHRVIGLGVDRPVVVIPLPIVDRPVTPEPAQAATIGVLGFVHPGKGHAIVLDATASLGREVVVVAGGGVSDGHGDLPAALAAHARRHRRTFCITGPLDEPSLRHFMATVTVPVVPAPAPSASMSLATWIGAGRRPLALANAYTCELVRQLPGRFDVVALQELARALAVRRRDPWRTWCDPAPLPERFRLESVAAAHGVVFAEASS